MKLFAAFAVACIVSLAIGAYDTTYRDSAGKTCASFVLGAHEADICSD